VPRSDRPNSRAILVDAPVSSMKTRRCGSSSACVARQACLCTATSGRSCSLACAVFFERHGVAIEEPPNRACCEPLAVPPLQMAGNLKQRDVVRLGEEPEDLLGMSFDPIGGSMGNSSAL
jgi:hypothetical protein